MNMLGIVKRHENTLPMDHTVKARLASLQTKAARRAEERHPNFIVTIKEKRREDRSTARYKNQY